MCVICKNAKEFKDPDKALKYISLAAPNGFDACVDKLIGELAGCEEPSVNEQLECDWERANHG